MGEECALAWKAWLEIRYGNEGIQVVLSESYRRKPGDSERKGQGTCLPSAVHLTTFSPTHIVLQTGSRIHNQPHIPESSLASLITALHNAHTALLTPPAYIANHPDPERRKRWRPRVRESVDWEAVLRAGEERRAGREPAREAGAAVVVLGEEQEGNGETESEESGGEQVTRKEGEDRSKEVPPVLGPLTVGLIGAHFS